jgi:hypothetical protein
MLISSEHPPIPEQINRDSRVSLRPDCQTLVLDSKHRKENNEMRWTKEMVAGIVQTARCAECDANFEGGMTLDGQEILCISCHAYRQGFLV